METTAELKDYQKAWQLVLGQLQLGMKRSDYKTWVDPIVPLGFNGNPDKYRLAVMNEYNKRIINSRMQSQISRLLSGFYKRDVEVEVIVSNDFESESEPENSNDPRSIDQIEPERPPTNKQPKKLPPEENQNKDENLPPKSKRKFILEQAYGDKRAALIQPDKGLYITKYMMEKWLPLLGHSTLVTIFIVRKFCYWNPYTGEKRDTIETDMSELANEACVSVRTLKTILKNDLVKRYFIRYSVRRVMTPNGIRTAGIRLQVRMDDPLTPEDQQAIGEIESGTWFSPEFEDESEEYEL